MKANERNICNADERRRCSLFQFATGRLPGCCSFAGPDLPDNFFECGACGAFVDNDDPQPTGTIGHDYCTHTA